jgi:hypothetical protein
MPPVTGTVTVIISSGDVTVVSPASDSGGRGIMARRHHALAARVAYTDDHDRGGRGGRAGHGPGSCRRALVKPGRTLTVTAARDRDRDSDVGLQVCGPGQPGPRARPIM